MTKMFMEIFLFNKSPEAHTCSHSPITLSSPGSMATSASGSIFRLSLDACQNMQEHWVDMGASLTRTQTLSNKDDHNCFNTAHNINTLQFYTRHDCTQWHLIRGKEKRWEKNLRVTGMEEEVVKRGK